MAGNLVKGFSDFLARNYTDIILCTLGAGVNFKLFSPNVLLSSFSILLFSLSTRRFLLKLKI